MLVDSPPGTALHHEPACEPVSEKFSACDPVCEPVAVKKQENYYKAEKYYKADKAPRTEVDFDMPLKFCKADWQQRRLIGNYANIIMVLKGAGQVALMGAVVFFIVETLRAVHSAWTSVQYGITTAATGASFMGLWAMMLHVCSWLSSLAPMVSTIQGMIAQYGQAQPIALQPAPLTFPGELDASDVTAVFGALVSVFSCVLGKWG